MKYRFLKCISIISIFTMLTSSCASKKGIVYLQESSGIQTESVRSNYEPKLQPDDILMIVISAENPEAALPYNQSLVAFQGSQIITTAQPTPTLQSYLIDKDGNVEFPILGKLKIGGLTRIEAIKKIMSLLEFHIKEPNVTIRILNFKVSVIGEVNRPGSFSIQSERITILEALSLAGDLTIYGNRNSILIIRDKEGLKTIAKVDITNRDFINSEYFYLSQNDQIYVEPNKTKVNASVLGPDITAGLTALSILVTILALTVKFK